VAVGREGVEEDVCGGVVGLAFLAEDAGDGGEEGEEIEGGVVVMGEGCAVEVPGAGYFTGDCFVEFLDCHGGVDFVLEILILARANKCKCIYEISDFYPKHHGSLDYSPDRISGFLESSIHVFWIRHIAFK
jgi:hypothetical protein